MRELLILISAVAVLPGCSNKSEVKAAINSSIEKDYNCLSLNSSDFIPFMDNKELEQYKKGNDFVIVDEDESSKSQKSTSHASEDSDLVRAEALVEAGLLTKTTKREQVMNPVTHKPVQSTIFAIHLYNLTKAGKETIQKKHINGLLGSGERKVAFCYGYPEVDKIINFNEFDYYGQKVVQVKYSYKLVGVSNWINSAEIKSAYPDVRQLLDNTNNKTAQIFLIKTDNGWQTHL